MISLENPDHFLVAPKLFFLIIAHFLSIDLIVDEKLALLDRVQ